ncbi:MAG: hypothetical protein K8R52_04150 [Bacteroidales bacterium]|nr:hypothetical protein [Bacteroidales bacterium]
MDASDIIRLLHTKHYAPADLDEVNRLCRNFPEFTVAHLLKVRIMEALGHEKQQQLKVAAVYSMDRKKLFQLVTEVVLPSEPEPEPEPVDETTGIIQFSNEPNQHADIIIEQHATYAGQEPDTDLLELDEEPTEELLEILDEEKSNNHLITSFIKGEQGPIRADQETNLKGDVSLASIREHDGYITDTLARIYIKQGLLAKAIYAYEKLSLKYPEKSAYFAAQIEKIRNLNHS